MIGLANDGVAAVPGVVRLTLIDAQGRVKASGCVDPGYPTPSGIRQVLLMMPGKQDWTKLRLKAELEVKGVRYALRRACGQSLNEDGSLSLRRNLRS